MLNKIFIIKNLLKKLILLLKIFSKKKKLKMNMISKIRREIAKMIEKNIEGKNPFIDEYGFEVQNKKTIEFKKEMNLLDNLKKNIIVQEIEKKNKKNIYQEENKKVKINLYEKKQSMNISQQINQKRKNFKIKLQECLKLEIQKFIDFEISETKNIQNKDIIPIKKTFFKLFYSKISKLIGVIILGDDHKFYKLLRKEYDYTTSEHFNNLYNTFLFYNRNIDKLNPSIIISFVKSVLNINSIKGQMFFLVSQYFNMDQNIERIITLEDSIFYYSENMKKELDNSKETGIDRNVFSQKLI